MKILKPELEVINEKFKDDAMKKQQETMKLYSILKEHLMDIRLKKI